MTKEFPQPKHESQRGYFAASLYEAMSDNEDIWLVTCDLGFKMWDHHFKDYPKRVINVGASEQAGVGIGIGLALEGKIPFVYSCTNFILYRPFEWIRNYLSHEQVPVKLVGSGRDDDYKKAGWTHQCPDARQALECFKLHEYWPETKEEIANMVREVVNNEEPSFISLRR